MKSTKIEWHVTGGITCPHCDKENEFMDMDEWYQYAEVAENKTFSEPIEWDCKHCKKPFIITESVY
jgi:phage terminase large subunit GpA-like protein